MLHTTALATGTWHWLAPPRPEAFRCNVRVRYRQSEQAARLEVGGDGSARIFFEQPQRAVTPGQYAVAYDGERCLGGGVIESVSSMDVRRVAA